MVDSENSSPHLISQILHQSGSRSAHINFLITNDSQDEKDAPALWDFLCYKAGEMGAVNVLAGLEESATLFETLRKAGFNVYGWETVWKFPKQLDKDVCSKDNWVLSTPTDEIAIRTLHQSLVPPLVQAAETFSNGGTPRLIYRIENEIVAYVESCNGPEGLYLKPVIHPSVGDITALLKDLASNFSDLGLPVYFQVRSYQAWLLDALQAVGGESCNRFTLLVKHLAIMQRNGVTIINRKRVESRQTEPTTPMVNTIIDAEHSAQVVKQS
ncbi:MAG: hypothetical protein FD147_1042 [Chloroflexi bacterium]|nr:MAG: hypothetical protein FD147_1042 [Chloroflexota bacterium]